MKIGLLANSQLAIPSLQQLLQEKKLTAVGVPADDNEYNRHISQVCSQHGIACAQLQRASLRAALTAWIQTHALDVVLVYTFPWLIPEACLALPPRGFYNAHFAPLPRYRGAAPLFWLIRNREPKGGFCVHLMTAAFDAGPIVYQRDLPLSARDTLGAHIGQLSLAAAAWTKAFLDQLTSDTLIPRAQDIKEAQSWSAPVMEDLVINWSDHTADEINALVKATNPHYGGAITYYQGFPLRILELTVLDGSSLPIGILPGTILNDQSGTVLFVACRKMGLVRIDVVKLEEGYFPGAKLFEWGVQPGTTFGTS